MGDATKGPNDVKQWTLLGAEGREKHYYENLAKLSDMSVQEIMDRMLPPEVKRHSWEKTECPRKDQGVFYNTMDGEQGAGDGKIYQWFKSLDTGETYRVPFFQGKLQGLSELFLNVMAKSKELSPWSNIDSLILDSNDLDFEDTHTRFGLVGRSAVMLRSGLENTVAAIASEEYSSNERLEIVMDRVGQISHESVHLNNQDTFMAMGNHRTLVEIGPQTIELLCFAHNGSAPFNDLDSIITILESGIYTHLDTYQEAVGVGVLLLARELDNSIKCTSLNEILDVLKRYKSILERIDSVELSRFREIAKSISLSVDNSAIIERLASMGVIDNRLGILEQLIGRSSS
ncbi:MAG: hypothetical protein DPW11_00600 [bacterium]|nr:hypothetical protein [bacterium]RIK51058.1 MAG: hypothetical protein DCC61_03685 [Candidatus Microgenomates bacterium]